MFAEPHAISPKETLADVGFIFYGWCDAMRQVRNCRILL
jgi:hypothetical protein